MPLQLSSLVTVGDRIKYIRELRGMTQPELAKRISISQPSMYNIESGKTKSPSAINLMKIAAVLEANPWWLLVGDGDPESMEDVNNETWNGVFSVLTPQQRRAIVAAAKAMSAESTGDV